MQRACEELKIEIIVANSPQDKGRTERAFDTFQDRLVPDTIETHPSGCYLRHQRPPQNCVTTILSVMATSST
jgi:hypothetical protein